MKKPDTIDAGRRAACVLLAGAGALLIAGYFAHPHRVRARGAAAYEIVHTDAQWLALLGAERYAVLREQATEAPFSSPLDHEQRTGVYVCAGCALPLFSSAMKYDSGTGWPSFWQPLANAVTEADDRSLGEPRTEVHCRRCGGHLGHVFDDGPLPTGLRYCINGLALEFRPA